MSYTTEAFAKNKEDMGISSIAPSINGYGVNDITAANDATASKVSLNNVVGGVSGLPPQAINYTTANNDHDGLVSGANIASSILRDKKQTGMQCESGSDLNYGVQQCSNLLRDTLTSLFSAPKSPENDLEMAAPRPQSYNFGL